MQGRRSWDQARLKWGVFNYGGTWCDDNEEYQGQQSTGVGADLFPLREAAMTCRPIGFKTERGWIGEAQSRLVSGSLVEGEAAWR
jgi:hypothetical protein